MEIKDLTAKKLTAAIDAQDKIVRDFLDAMIHAGRGHERMTETRELAARGFDPLASDFVAAMNRAADLETERRARLEYHGKLSPIRRAA